MARGTCADKLICRKCVQHLISIIHTLACPLPRYKSYSTGRRARQSGHPAIPVPKFLSVPGPPISLSLSYRSGYQHETSQPVFFSRKLTTAIDPNNPTAPQRHGSATATATHHLLYFATPTANHRLSELPNPRLSHLTLCACLIGSR